MTESTGPSASADGNGAGDGGSGSATAVVDSGLSLRDGAAPGQPNLLLEEPQRIAADPRQLARAPARGVRGHHRSRRRRHDARPGAQPRARGRPAPDLPEVRGRQPVGHAEGPHRLRAGDGRAAPRLRRDHGRHLRQLRRGRSRSAASLAGLRCVVLHPRGLPHAPPRRDAAATAPRSCASPGDYESAVEVSRAAPTRDELYDANPGGANTALQLQAYGEIADEIYDELRDAPAAVAVPVSNGTTLAGIYRGFLSLYRRGKTSRMPRMVAGSSHRKNPIVQAFLQEPAALRGPRSEVDPRDAGQRAADQLALARRRSCARRDPRRRRAGPGTRATRTCCRMPRLIREQQGLNVLPASTAGLVVLLDRHRRERFLAIATS